MGFSLAAAAAVLLVGFLYYGSALATSFLDAQGRVEEGLRDANGRLVAAGLGALRIDSVAHNATLQRITVLAANTGGATFDAGRLDVLVDGAWRTNDVTSRRVEGIATEVWPAQTQLELNVTAAAAPAALTLVAGNGLADTWRA